MLQVAVRRLRTLWPQATINVITESAYLLRLYCPEAQPIVVAGRYGRLPGFINAYVPRPIAQSVLSLRAKAWNTYPNQARLASQLIKKVSHRSRAGQAAPARDESAAAVALPPPQVLEAIHQSDLVVATGGGYLVDGFDHAFVVLNTLQTAIELGKPTAMLGQGIGPVSEPTLLAKAQQVLPLVDLIALREQRASLPILKQLAVDLNRVITTGDDAVELAYQSQPADLGTGIGINLRLASYSDVQHDEVNLLRQVLHRVAAKYHAPLISLPVSQVVGESDSQAIRQLLAGYRNTVDSWEQLSAPATLIQRIATCRVVVTGSYHAAVFALSQGIPVVGLAKSNYYKGKFLGLADQFGTGCHVVLLDDELLPARLEEALDAAWSTAKAVRPQLLAAAKQQIERGHTAYRRLGALLPSA
jgi:polysaccharide pyruvyl transferase WcaK-like protein